VIFRSDASAGDRQEKHQRRYYFQFSFHLPPPFPPYYFEAKVLFQVAADFSFFKAFMQSFGLDFIKCV
jgi:hypothetical protein